MKVEFEARPGLAEPEIRISADRLTPELEELMASLSALRMSPIPAFQNGQAVLLEPGEVLRFYGEEQKVFAQTEQAVYTLRLRLYELEERLDPARFVRISHSEIVNLKWVTALDLSLSGTIRMTLAGGAAVCYASRRSVKKIKEALGLGGRNR